MLLAQGGPHWASHDTGKVTMLATLVQGPGHRPLLPLTHATQLLVDHLLWVQNKTHSFSSPADLLQLP